MEFDDRVPDLDGYPIILSIKDRQDPLDVSSHLRWMRRRSSLIDDSHENALAETINGLYKAEVIHRRGPWRSFETIEYAMLKWADWFSHRHLLAPIKNIPPAEAEDQYYAVADAIDMAA